MLASVLRPSLVDVFLMLTPSKVADSSKRVFVSSAMEESNPPITPAIATGLSFEQIMSIGKEDVMIAISFPRYSKRIIHAVDFAHHAGADVIALTDSMASPIAVGANQILTAKSDMASFADSLVAPMSVINALIVAVTRERSE